MPEKSTFIMTLKERASWIIACTFTVISTYAVYVVLRAETRLMIKVSSPAFSYGQPIPTKYTCEGDDVSPPIRWENVPSSAKSLVVVCLDPDAPTKEPWVHWMIYDIPPVTDELSGLRESVPRQKKLEHGMKQGINTFPKDNVGYRGPCPPRGHGIHRYYFYVYALDTMLSALSEGGITKKQLFKAMRGHVVAEGLHMGTFERQAVARSTPAG